MDILEDIKNFYCSDSTGHDYSHTMRVYTLAIKFANRIKNNCDFEILKFSALLHDVDDYKLVGKENSLKLKNANYFLDKYEIDINKKKIILDNIKNMGYHNAIDGIIPKSIEGKIVSDADMCDAIGSHGIVRTIQYNHSKGNKFFDINVFPVENLNSSTYVNKKNVSAVNHIFEKMLKLDRMMLTSIGKEEALKRIKIVEDFLRNYFEEESNEEWLNYLDNYIKKNSN